MSLLVKILNILVLFCVLISCGAEKKTKLKLSLSNIVIGGHSIPGGAILYGHNSSSDLKVSINLHANQDTVFLDNGQWDFLVLGWYGSENMEGTVKCGGAHLNLNGEEAILNISITAEKCTSPPPEISKFITTNPFKVNLNFLSCGSIPSTPTPSSNCSGDLGAIQSLQVTLFTQAPGTDNIGLKSKCYNLSSGIASPAALKIPFGNGAQSPFHTIIDVFDASECIGNHESFDLLDGPSNDGNILLQNITSEYTSRFDATNGAIFIKTASFSSLPPTFTSVTPNSGPATGGNTITVSGANFISGVIINIDGNLCSNIIIIDSSTLTCEAAAYSPGLYDIEVTNPDLQSVTSSSAYTYNVTDVTPPEVFVEQAITESISSCSFTAQPDPATTNNIEYKVAFNEPIDTSTFTNIDISNFGTGGATTLLWNIENCGDNTHFKITTSTIDGEGTIIPSINAGSVDDIASNSNNASTSTDNSVATSGSFVSKWRTTVANETITLPLRPTYSYNFIVDWGDGSPTNTITYDGDTNKTHTYTIAGDYIVTISGSAQSWYFDNSGDRSKIIEVKSLGNLGWTDLNNAFKGCDNLTIFKGGITANVSNMAYMFMGTTSLSTIDLSSFDTTNVTTMYGMFKNANSITNLNLSNFNTSGLTNTGLMFYGMSSLNSINLSSFDTSSVTGMSYMFSGVSNLVNLDLSNFDTSLVTSTSFMFEGMSSLTNLDISSFVTSNVNNMNSMFSGASAFNGDLSGWNTANVTDMSSMFKNATGFNGDISGWDTGLVTTMSEMFHDADAFNQNIGSWNVSNVLNMNQMFKGTASFDQDISSWNTSAVTNMSLMFNQATAFNQSLSVWNVSNVTQYGTFADGATLYLLAKPSFI